MTAPKKRSFKRYLSFHGKRVRGIAQRMFHVPENLILLGRAHQIVYVTDKINGGGDGKIAEYIHTFETPVNLYMDETGKKQLYLMGQKLKVTSHGIEN